MNNPHDGPHLGQVVAPQQEGQGGYILHTMFIAAQLALTDHLVRISPLAVHLGVVTVTKTHRSPYSRSAGTRLLVGTLALVTIIVYT